MGLTLICLQVLSETLLAPLSARERVMLKNLMRTDSTGAQADSFLVSVGFWEAQIAYSHIGPRYRLSDVEILGDSVAVRILNQQILRAWEKKPLTADFLQTLAQALLHELGKAGYLYAVLSWRAFNSDTHGLCTAQVWIASGEAVRLDTVFVKGRWPAPLSAFHRMTGLWPRRPLSRSAWEKLPASFARNPYAMLVDTPKLWLFPGLAWIELTVRPRQNNRLEGALGLASDPLRAGRAQLVGDFKAQLTSPLRLGETFQVSYSQLVGGSQRLRLDLGFPYLFRGLVRWEGHFHLLRQDTSFLLRALRTRWAYALTAEHTLLVGLGGETARLLSTVAYRQRTWPPPPNLDYRRRSVSLGWQYEGRNDPINPHTGWFLEIEGVQGFRGYIPNPGLPRLDYTRLPPPGPYQEAAATIERFIPLGRRTTIRSRTQGYRYWVATFFENELRRSAGPKDLRGFAENSLATYFFAQGTIEPRLHLDVEDYIGLFVDGGWVGLYPRQTHLFQAFGFALQTRLPVGLLRLSFTLGRLLPTPFEPRRTLVSIEWLNSF